MQTYGGNGVSGNFVKVAAGSPKNAEIWMGTKAEVDAVNPKDPDTIYIGDEAGGGIGELLDFNPVLVDSNGVGVYNMSDQTAKYSRIGSLVFVNMFFQVLDTTNVPTGYLRVNNLPATASPQSILNISIDGEGQNFYSVQCKTNYDHLYFDIQDSLDNDNTEFFNAPVINNGVIRISGFYSTQE